MRPQGTYPALRGKALSLKTPAEGRRGRGVSQGGQRGAGSHFPSEMAPCLSIPLLTFILLRLRLALFFVFPRFSEDPGQLLLREDNVFPPLGTAGEPSPLSFGAMFIKIRMRQEIIKR